MTGSGATSRYKKKNCLRVAIDFNRKTEPELVEKVESVENKTGYIKGLIRDDIGQDEGKEGKED